MHKSEGGKWNPDRDTHAEAGQEIKWVYAAALPPEEGQPNVELILGVPEGADWLRPDSSSDEPSVYRFELPVNIVSGGGKSKMTVDGLVRAESPDTIRFKHMSLHQEESDDSTVWSENHLRVSRDASTLLCNAVIDQCKAYLAAHGGRAAEHGG